MTNNALFQFCLRMGDTNLILGHRLSELCSRGPFLEEDIALTNFALDHIGQAEAFLQYAGQIEGKNRSEDDLAYLRPEWEFRNCLLAEQPNTDFAYVIARQFFIDVWQCLMYEALKKSADQTLADMGARFIKEALYHRRHSTAWIIRLAHGTDESRRRIEKAILDLWKYTAELFVADPLEAELYAETLIPSRAVLHAGWFSELNKVFAKADLPSPESYAWNDKPTQPGVHTEHMGHLLAEMQYLQRAFPGAQW